MTKSFLLLLLLADFKSFLKFKLVLFKKKPNQPQFFSSFENLVYHIKILLLRRLEWILFSL